MPYTYHSPSDVIEVNENKELRILMLEDNNYDAELLQMYLKSSTGMTLCTLVTNKQEYIKALDEEEFDVILSDHNLPQFSSLEALKIRNEKKFHVPFILVSGAIPEEYAVMVLQAGANDYILKDRPQRLMTAIREAIRKQKAIADKLRTEEELLKVNERLRLVLKATAEAIWDWNLNTNEMFFGEGFEKLFGYTPALPTTPDTRTNYIHADDRQRVLNGIKTILASPNGTNWMEEYRFRKKDGTFAIIVDKGMVLRDEQNVPYRMVGAMQDLSQLRKLEEEIHDQKIQHQKQNTEIAMQAQEQERNFIGRELHDNINQLLANAKMMIDTARKSDELYETCISRGYESIVNAIEETRKLSHTLVQPAFNSHHTFPDAVNNIVSDIEMTAKINIEIDIPDGEENVIADEKIQLAFYRIIQEQMNNIVKYSRAEKALIRLSVDNDFYRLTISDNGVGFDQENKPRGIGIKNISNRAEILGGSMQLKSAPGMGCVMLIEIPREGNGQ